jgi:GT2 family glycosyltransferase
MDITIIVVSHNTRDMTIECIRSVISETMIVKYELIVFDSGSTDGSVDAIQKMFPQIALITSAKDVGFANANNIAAKTARGRRLLLLNPDTVILDRAIDRLYAFAEANTESRIWGGRTVFADGSLNPGSCWRHSTPWSVLCFASGLTSLKSSSVFNPESYGRWKRDTVRAVEIVSGCFFLIDRDLWQDLNGFDPVFFMYGEEADLCMRAHKLGARPMITPTATIIHYGGGSYPDESERQIHVLTGRVTLMHRHWGTLSRFVGRYLYYMIPLTRWLGYSVAVVISQNNKYRKNAQVWREVWQNRKEWIRGWTDVVETGLIIHATRGGAQQ